ncbi:MAG TPA: DUF1016 N-terminal domain-containing protein [Hymenobacter sp.]|jgi:predicted nuclease of restriction endonuclease-like (RecB) superfamily
MTSPLPPDYAQLLTEIKSRVREAQYRALHQVNREQMQLYWELGRLIAERQQQQGWGKAIVENLARDLQKEFAGMSGFSVQNLWYMRQFYLEYSAIAVSWTIQLFSPGSRMPAYATLFA